MFERRLMIRTYCPHCKEPLKAPDQLAGKKGRCPACRGVVPHPQPTESVEHPAAGEDVSPLPTAKQTGLGTETGLTLAPPETLRRNCHYLICNSREVIARWDDDGKGWMIHIKDGFVKAIQNPKQIPSMGNYVLIEIEVTSDGARQRLTGIHCFTLPGDFVLNKLAKKNENSILEGIEGTTELQDSQRVLVKQRINANYLPNIWEDAIEF